MRMSCILILLTLIAPSSARAQYDKNPEPKPPTPRQVEGEGPRASVVFAPTGARDPVDLPRDKMIEALSEIDKGDAKEAGHELKKAIEAMQAAADTSLGEAIKSNVLRSVVELSSRAERMRQGGAVTADELTPMFSRALQALAEHHAALAQSHFQNGDNWVAGQDLRASVLDANQALVWGNVKATPDDTGRLNTAGRTAKNMIDQKMVDKVGAGKIIVDLQHWVHDLRARLPKAAG
jgi:hypothetical protein